MYLQRHRNLFGESGERQLKSLMGSVGANALFGLMSPRIDNWAHLGGLLAGAAITFAAGPNLMVVEGGGLGAGVAGLVGGRGGKGAKLAGQRSGGRTVVNRPLLQTYVGEFVREFRDDGGGGGQGRSKM